MPNKRSPNKKIYTIWLDKQKTEEIEKMANKYGMTKTEFAQYAFEIALKNLNPNPNKQNENTDKTK